MPIILCRHGATAKNIEGGIDDRTTKLHAEGLRQATETGHRLSDFCKRQGIKRLRPFTSGYERTNTTCDRILNALENDFVEIFPRVEDDRIGEIKFLPRDIIPTAQNPGIFGRVIDGMSLSDVLAGLAAFDRDYLCNIEDDTACVVFGHRTTHRLLAMTHLQHSIEWMERTLPRMDNCELWQLRAGGDIEVLHPGYPALRDEPDARRDGLH